MNVKQIVKVEFSSSDHYTISIEGDSNVVNVYYNAYVEAGYSKLTYDETVEFFEGTRVKLIAEHFWRKVPEIKTPKYLIPIIPEILNAGKFHLSKVIHKKIRLRVFDKKKESNSIIKYLKSLKFILPKNVREEFLLDIEEMYQDMRSQNLNGWWIRIIILGNISAVIWYGFIGKIQEYFKPAKAKTE